VDETHTHANTHNALDPPHTLSTYVVECVDRRQNVRGRQVDDTHTHTHTTHSTLHNILHIRGLDSPFSTYVECVVCVCVCVIHLPPTFSTYVECVWRVEGHSILHTHSPHTFSTHILHIRGLDSPHSTLNTHTLSRVSTVKV